MTENYFAQNAISASWEHLHYTMVFNSFIVFGHWVHCFSVTWSCLTLCYPMDRLPCPPQTPRAYSHSHPLSWWCHPTISSSVVPFTYLQSFPDSGTFPMSQFFTPGSQSIGVSASACLPMNIQDWFPWGLTGLISLQSKGLSIVFSSTTVQKHQFFGTQPSFWSNSHSV